MYRVVHGEISPFRLVRMSQKDMQATKISEPSPKETTEVKVLNTPTKDKIRFYTLTCYQASERSSSVCVRSDYCLPLLVCIQVKDAAAKATGLLQKPEAVKVDLPSLNPARPDRSTVCTTSFASNWWNLTFLYGHYIVSPAPYKHHGCYDTFVLFVCLCRYMLLPRNRRKVFLLLLSRPEQASQARAPLYQISSPVCLRTQHQSTKLTSLT